MTPLGRGQRDGDTRKGNCKVRRARLRTVCVKKALGERGRRHWGGARAPPRT